MKPSQVFIRTAIATSSRTAPAACTAHASHSAASTTRPVSAARAASTTGPALLKTIARATTRPAAALTLTLALALSLTACHKSDGPDAPAMPEFTVDAASATEWYYYSFEDKRIVGSGPAAGDAAWRARTDWDIAFQRYYIRTNSGASTTVGAHGGVYACAAETGFASVIAVPENADFEVDTEVVTQGHGGSTSSTVRSGAQSTFVVPPTGGGTTMTYNKPPVYIFRTAAGDHYYKVEFLRYFDDAGESGHVTFSAAKLK